jgi:hypothetical protein
MSARKVTMVYSGIQPLAALGGNVTRDKRGPRAACENFRLELSVKSKLSIVFLIMYAGVVTECRISTLSSRI